MNGPVAAPSGSHVLHVKVWSDAGNVCVTDVSIDLSGGSASTVVPSDAVRVSSIQTLSNWTAIHDGGTTGSSSGAMSMASSLSLTGDSRLFATEFNDFGGERFSVQFDDNTTS